MKRANGSDMTVLSVDGSSNVWIGGTNSGQVIAIGGSTVSVAYAATFSSTVATGGNVTVSGGQVLVDNGWFYAVKDSAGGSSRIYFGAGSNVGLSGSGDHFVLANNTTSGAFLWGTGASATERMRLTSGGNLLIGTTTDTGHKLHVAGSARIAGDLTITGAFAPLSVNANGPVGSSGSGDTIYLHYNVDNAGNPGLYAANQAGFNRTLLLGAGGFETVGNFTVHNASTSTGYVSLTTTPSILFSAGGTFSEISASASGLTFLQAATFSSTVTVAGAASFGTSSGTYTMTLRPGAAKNATITSSDTALDVQTFGSTPIRFQMQGGGAVTFNTAVTFNALTTLGSTVHFGSASTDGLIITADSATKSIQSYGGDALQLNPAGNNVLVGTTTDAGYKLDVVGTLRATGAATFSSTVEAGGFGRFKGYTASGSGLAAEAGIAAGEAYFQSYNRTTSAYAPVVLGGSEVKLATGGTTRVTIAASGAATFSSNLIAEGNLNAEGQGRFKAWYTSGTGAAAEIGVASGQAQLIGYNRSTGSYINLHIEGGAVGQYILMHSGGITINGAATFSSTVTTTGGVGVGAALSVGTSLVVGTTISAGGSIAATGLSAYIQSGSGSDYVRIVHDYDGFGRPAVMWSNSSPSVSASLHLADDGRLSTSAGLLTSGTVTGGAFYAISYYTDVVYGHGGGTRVQMASNTGNLILYANTTAQVTVSTSGVAVAGTLSAAATTVTTLLTGDGSASSPGHTFSNDTNTGLFRAGTDILAVATAGTEALRILANRRVMIGFTTDQGYELSVSGSIYASAGMQIGGNAVLHAASALNASNLLSGTVPMARIPAALNITNGSFDGTYVTANVGGQDVYWPATAV